MAGRHGIIVSKSDRLWQKYDHDDLPPINHCRLDFKAARSWGEKAMLRTITLGSCVSVQGMFERQLENGKILVRVGKLLFEGYPVVKVAA